MMSLQDLMSMNVLNECAMECTRQSRWKETTQRYLANMLVSNFALRENVLNGRYAVSPTIDFDLNERGHIRHIEAPVVRDRVIQKAFTKYILTPSIRPYLIYDNYASLKERGTSFARRRFKMMLQDYIRKNGTGGYVLLIDVRKYFESVDHDVLKQLVEPRLKGAPDDVMALIHYMIDTSSKTNKGLNLGSEAPQIFAVYYMNCIDTYVKVVKGVRYYGRYMDDIFIIGGSKAEMMELLEEIRTQLSGLRLEINDKKTHVVKLSHGFTWLQIKYDILPTGRILTRPSHGKIVRERRRLKALRRMVDKGKMSVRDAWLCYQSWRGSVVRDHNAYHDTILKMDVIFRSLFPEHEEEKPKSRARICSEIYSESEKSDLYFLFNN